MRDRGGSARSRRRGRRDARRQGVGFLAAGPRRQPAHAVQSYRRIHSRIRPEESVTGRPLRSGFLPCDLPPPLRRAAARASKTGEGVRSRRPGGTSEDTAPPIGRRERGTAALRRLRSHTARLPSRTVLRQARGRAAIHSHRNRRQGARPATRGLRTTGRSRAGF